MRLLQKILILLVFVSQLLAIEKCRAQLSAVQNQTIDSLTLKLNHANHDTIRGAALIGMGELLYNQNPDSALSCWNLARDLCVSVINKKTFSAEVKKTMLQQLAFSLNNMAMIYEQKGNSKLAISCFEESFRVFDSLGNTKRASYALSGLGDVYENLGDLLNSELNYNKALNLQMKISDSIGISTSLHNLAYLYYNQGNTRNAISCWEKSLRIRELIHDDPGSSSTLNNLASIYKDQGDLTKALEYFLKSLKIREKIGNKNLIANSLTNIGGIYNQQNKLDLALDYYTKSLKLREETGNKKGIASCLLNIAGVYKDRGSHKVALDLYEKALSVYRDIDAPSGIANTLHHLGSFYYYQLKDKVKAQQLLLESIEISNKTGIPEFIRNAAQLLTVLYKDKGDYKNAIASYELYIKMRDSLNNIETQKATIKQQTKYEYEKQKAVEDEKHAAEIKQQEEKAATEKKRQNIVIASVSVVLLLVAVFSVILFNRFRVTQKQKAIIELKEKETQFQKHLIEEKHKEITDSINYAERIQRSFLATQSHLDQNLSSPLGGGVHEDGGGQYFVLFKPKDVVSGDFYWSATLNNGNFALATADSTGHGVPGAIMSLLNITSLEKAIETETAPDKILNTTRKIIIDRLKKDGSPEGGKDGMDCSLCVFDFKNKKLFVANANNPVWIVRNSDTEASRTSASSAVAPIAIGVETTVTKNVIEVKADKMPVGKHDKQDTPFTLKEYDLQKGDIIYTLTDGFPDQFGGEKGKKFMSKNLRELLATNSSLPMNEQKSLLEKTFKDWVGDLEQVDDVTVIGIRV